MAAARPGGPADGPGGGVGPSLRGTAGGRGRRRARPGRSRGSAGGHPHGVPRASQPAAAEPRRPRVRGETHGDFPGGRRVHGGDRGGAVGLSGRGPHAPLPVRQPLGQGVGGQRRSGRGRTFRRPGRGELPYAPLDRGQGRRGDRSVLARVLGPEGVRRRGVAGHRIPHPRYPAVVARRRAAGPLPGRLARRRRRRCPPRSGTPRRRNGHGGVEPHARPPQHGRHHRQPGTDRGGAAAQRSGSRPPGGPHGVRPRRTHRRRHAPRTSARPYVRAGTGRLAARPPHRRRPGRVRRFRGACGPHHRSLLPRSPTAAAVVERPCPDGRRRNPGRQGRAGHRSERFHRRAAGRETRAGGRSERPGRGPHVPERRPHRPLPGAGGCAAPLRHGRPERRRRRDGRPGRWLPCGVPSGEGHPLARGQSGRRPVDWRGVSSDWGSPPGARQLPVRLRAVARRAVDRSKPARAAPRRRQVRCPKRGRAHGPGGGPPGRHPPAHRRVRTVQPILDRASGRHVDGRHGVLAGAGGRDMQRGPCGRRGPGAPAGGATRRSRGRELPHLRPGTPHVARLLWRVRKGARKGRRRPHDGVRRDGAPEPQRERVTDPPHAPARAGPWAAAPAAPSPSFRHLPAAGRARQSHGQAFLRAGASAASPEHGRTAGVPAFREAPRPLRGQVFRPDRQGAPSPWLRTGLRPGPRHGTHRALSRVDARPG